MLQSQDSTAGSSNDSTQKSSSTRKRKGRIHGSPLMLLFSLPCARMCVCVCVSDDCTNRRKREDEGVGWRGEGGVRKGGRRRGEGKGRKPERRKGKTRGKACILLVSKERERQNSPAPPHTHAQMEERETKTRKGRERQRKRELDNTRKNRIKTRTPRRHDSV